MIRQFRYYIMALSLSVLFMATACKDGDKVADSKQLPEEPDVEKTLAEKSIEPFVSEVREVSELNTTEATLTKDMSWHDVRTIMISLFGTSFKIENSALNVDVVLKVKATFMAAIDMSRFEVGDVVRDDSTITVILPDPRLKLTSVTVDESKSAQRVGWLRSSIDDAKYQQLIRRAKADIIREIDPERIILQARFDAENMIVPMLTKMGYKKENINVKFSRPAKEFKVTEIIFTDKLK